MRKSTRWGRLLLKRYFFSLKSASCTDWDNDYFYVTEQLRILSSGLGAMTAVLMLVFKDFIMGLGQIQLSLNNMISLGDWLEMSVKAPK